MTPGAIQRIARCGQSFTLYVSLRGTLTGAAQSRYRLKCGAGAGDHQQQTALPVGVGFCIGSPEAAAAQSQPSRMRWLLSAARWCNAWRHSGPESSPLHIKTYRGVPRPVCARRSTASAAKLSGEVHDELVRQTDSAAHQGGSAPSRREIAPEGLRGGKCGACTLRCMALRSKVTRMSSNNAAQKHMQEVPHLFL